MLATFFARPLVKFGLPVLAVVIAGIWFAIWLSGVKKEAKQEGVTQERTGALIETVNRMENASETRREIADPGSRARYDECMRSARTPENCKRFLPQ